MFRAYRERAGLSQKARADKAGLTPSQVSRIEAGKVNPQYGTLRALLDAMHVSGWHVVELAKHSVDRSRYWYWEDEDGNLTGEEWAFLKRLPEIYREQDERQRPETRENGATPKWESA